jgi:hypothetical protein
MTWPNLVAASLLFPLNDDGLGLTPGRLGPCGATVDFPSTCLYNGFLKYASAGPRESTLSSSSVSWLLSATLERSASFSSSTLRISSSASVLSLSDTPSYHATICLSGCAGKHCLGRILGRFSPVSGSLISQRRTASMRNLVCSSGPRSSCIVCHMIQPSFFSAGMVGSVNAAECGRGCKLCRHPRDL